MKTRLLLLLLLTTFFSFSQVPTNGLSEEYLFTNGSYLTTAGSNDLVESGGTITTTPDRNGAPTNAISLNGSFLHTPLNLNNSYDNSISLWIKTTTNESNSRVIYDNHERVFPTPSATEIGFYLTLDDGKIDFTSNYMYGHDYLQATESRFYSGVQGFRSNASVDDNNWHNITVTMDIDGGGSSGTVSATYNLYIDGLLDNTSTITRTPPANSGALFIFLQPEERVTIGNSKNGNLGSTAVYQDAIDDIHVYDRVLSPSEVITIFNNVDACNPTQLTATNIQSSSVDLSWTATAQQTAWDVTYTTPGGDPSSGTIVSNVGASPYTLTGLQPLTAYDVYVRSMCNGLISGWSNVAAVNTIAAQEVIYVDVDATGLNNGTSWANAYTDLSDALIGISAGTERSVWIADGTYIPTTTNANGRTATYRIPSSISLYGGFNATETMLSQRNTAINTTILSGDVLGNDNGILALTEATRSDNLMHIISLRDDISDVLIDGVTISGGHANSSGTFTGPVADRIHNGLGGAIYVALLNNLDRVEARFNDCVLEHNSAKAGGVLGSYVQNGNASVSYNVDFTNSKIRSNFSDTNSVMLFQGATGAKISGQVTNCLFTDNTTTLTRNTGSCLWISRVNGPANVVMVDVVNSTFTNNTAQNGKVITATGAAELSTISNCIIYGNGSNTPLDFYTAPFTVVNNSILEGGQEGGINLDPLFTSATDFTLMPNSPAINAGDNNFIPVNTTQDLAGNQRVFNTTVDLGAYEFNTECGEFFNVTLTPSATVATEAALHWEHPFNPGTTFDIVYVVSGMPIGSGTVISNVTGTTQLLTGLSSNFYDVYLSADCSGVPSANQLSTLGFKVPLFVDVNATGTNNGSNWANAFTSLESALAVAQDNDNIWVAAGTYTPAGTSRLNSFNINQDNLIIYGGFNGTETQLTQRNFTINKSIISGDLNGNDGVANFSGNGRDENLYHIIEVNSENVTFNGVVVSGGQATASSGDDRFGGGIFKDSNVLNLTIANCTFTDNVAIGGGAVFNRSGNGDSVTILNSTFKNNLGTYAAGLYVINEASATNAVSVSNSLFYNNTTKNNGSTLGYTGSSMWLRANGSGSALTSTITNCTFADNLDVGTQVATYKRGTCGLSRNSGASHSAFIYNSIYYDNKGASATTTRAISIGHSVAISAIAVSHSIDEDGFAGVPSGSKTSTLTSNPLFSNTANNDYTLTANSPAVNTGNNTYVIGTEDLNRNARTFNSTVDMGAYEYSSTLSIDNFSIVENEIKLYPNPTTSVLNIKMKNNIKQATVYSVLGVKVLVITSKTLNTSNLKSGMYLITIEDETGHVSTKRFIKQ